jgi:hypothetical protein
VAIASAQPVTKVVKAYPLPLCERCEHRRGLRVPRVDGFDDDLIAAPGDVSAGERARVDDRPHALLGRARLARERIHGACPTLEIQADRISRPREVRRACDGDDDRCETEQDHAARGCRTARQGARRSSPTLSRPGCS